MGYPGHAWATGKCVESARSSIKDGNGIVQSRAHLVAYFDRSLRANSGGDSALSACFSASAALPLYERRERLSSASRSVLSIIVLGSLYEFRKDVAFHV